MILNPAVYRAVGHEILNSDHEFAPNVDKLTMDSPAPLLADADGKEFSRVVGAKYQTVDDFLAWMKKQLLNKDLD